MIVKKAHARIGLMGNPSDGFYGKTLSCCIDNYHAEVILAESHRMRIIPHESHDPTEFSSLGELAAVSSRYGYYGGLRLIYATCKRFHDYCKEHTILLGDRNCTIRYDTNIPRQVGLGGSSAIIVALLKALMAFYNLTDGHIPLELQPNLVRSVETNELGIMAGLQDRVIQIYGGLVYMDFAKSLMTTLGHGSYLRMDPKLLPGLFLVYLESPGKDSGKVHNKMRFRFQSGDPDVLAAMCGFATFAVGAKQALEEGDIQRFGMLMNSNFSLRQCTYGREAVNASLEMIHIARNLKAPVKFPGSGGAVVGIYSSDHHCDQLCNAYREAGYEFTKVVVNSGN